MFTFFCAIIFMVINMMKVVGTMFIDDNKLLLDKPRKNPTYQLIAGKVEEETILEAAIRECYEELGDKVTIDESLFKEVMDFEETASSDPNLKIHFYLFYYDGKLKGELTTSDEIESFFWYDTSMKDIKLSHVLNNKVIPYCLNKKLIK